MSHFAQVQNGIVTQVLVVEQDVVNSGLIGDPAEWIQTSYNTRGNVHYGVGGQPDSGVALRGNYASIGYTYDAANDVFYAAQPYPSWTLNTTTWLWTAPTPMPTDGNQYFWNESTVSWELVPNQPA